MMQSFNDLKKSPANQCIILFVAVYSFRIGICMQFWSLKKKENHFICTLDVVRRPNQCIWAIWSHSFLQSNSWQYWLNEAKQRISLVSSLFQMVAGNIQCSSGYSTDWRWENVMERLKNWTNHEIGQRKCQGYHCDGLWCQQNICVFGFGFYRVLFTNHQRNFIHYLYKINQFPQKMSGLLPKYDSHSKMCDIQSS